MPMGTLIPDCTLIAPNPNLPRESLHGAVVQAHERKRYSSTSSSYSNSRLDEILGLADNIIVHAFVEEAGGTNPTLTVDVEDSSDGENWATFASSLINAASLTGTGVNTTYRAAFSDAHGRFLRLKVTIGGTGSPYAVLSVRATLKQK